MSSPLGGSGRVVVTGFGAVTPLGGIAMIGGLVAFALAALRSAASP